MDISFKTTEGRFNYGVAGVLIHNNKLLIMKDENSPFYYIPGGRVNLHELCEHAIIREIKEKLSWHVKVNRMLWIHENFFHQTAANQYYNENAHEICFYYLLDIPNDKLTSCPNEFTLKENGEHDLKFYWKSIDEIKN